MSLSSTSINRPVLATVVNIIIIILGAIGFTYLGVRDYPSVDPSIVTVTTTFPGANADVIETQITEPLESAINGVPGIRSISSESRDGRSRITVEFNLEVPMETAANDVRDKVSGALSRLPRDVDPPVVEKADADAQPIFGVNLRSDHRSMIDLSDYAEINFKERLQTITGVSSVTIWGSKKMAVRLKMDPARLAAYALTPLDVRDAVANENVELPSGRIEGQNTELTVRTFGRLQTIDDFNNLVIYQDGSRMVRFSDIGVAEREPENIRSILRVNGVPSVNCVLIPQPGANYIDIVDRAKTAIEDLKKSIPEDIIVETVFDNTIFIRQSLAEVQHTIFEAFILVVLIIFVFLRNWRTTLIPVLAIPVSLIGVFFVMYLVGFSINTLTLFAVVLAIGIVVDDAIVVMENIYTKIEGGMSPKEAGIKGSEEIFFAVIATTITLVAVFFPIVFLQGVTGRLFREFSIVIAGAVCISAFVALTFTPMLSTKLLTKHAAEGRMYRFTDPFFTGLNNVYRRSLAWFMRRRYIALGIIVAALAGIVWLWRQIPSEMAPLEDRSYITVNSVAQEGITFDYMERYSTSMIAMIEDGVAGEFENLMTNIGSNNVNASWVRIKLVEPERRQRKQQEIADAFSQRVKLLTGARSFVTQQQTFGGRRGGLPVQYVIQAKNLDGLKDVMPAFMEEVSKSPVFSASDLNLKFTKPEVTITINREKAALLGLSVQNIAQTLQLTMSEQRIGYYIYNGKQYQILSQYDRPNRNKPSDLTNAYVRNANNELIQLDNVVTIRESSMPPQLYRYNRFVAATVAAGLSKGYTLGQGIDEMNRIAADVLSKDDFSTTLFGDSKDFAESSSSLLFAFILALILIYLILAAQFESFRDPIVIMVTVPLSVIGALLAIKVYGQTMNIFSEIGIIMLIGLVTKNGILIVEFANQRRTAGLPVREAIQEAAVSRFRPILMTSLATILGILPLATASGAGAESRVAMGITVVGGMIFATFLTLYVVPAVYSYFVGTREA